MSKAFVKGRERNVPKNVMHVQSCLLIKTIVFSEVLLAVAVVVADGDQA